MEIEVGLRQRYGMWYVDVLGPDAATVETVKALVGTDTLTARQVDALRATGHTVVVVDTPRDTFTPFTRRPWTEEDSAKVAAAREMWRAAQASRKGRGAGVPKPLPK